MLENRWAKIKEGATGADRRLLCAIEELDISLTLIWFNVLFLAVVQIMSCVRRG